MAKILIVEDEPDLRDELAGHLEDEGFDVLQACNGQEGLERFATDTPDLVISDITMPVMDGHQFLRQIKQRHPQIGYIPFLFLTALADRKHELKGLHLGADDYISKPVDFELLSVRVELCLRRQKEIRNDAYERVSASGSIVGDTEGADHRNDPASDLQIDSLNDISQISSIEKTARQQTRASLKLQIQSKITQSYTSERLVASKMIKHSGRAANSIRLSLNHKKEEEVFNKFHLIDMEDNIDFFVQITNIFFKRIKSYFECKNIDPDTLIIIPVHFLVICHPAIRANYLLQIHSFVQEHQRLLMNEIVSMPDKSTRRISTQSLDFLRGHAQVIEAKDHQQLAKIDLKALSVGVVSMTYNDASCLQSDELVDLRQSLSSQGIRFYVKNVPEGRLMMAQSLQADFYSMAN